MTRGGLKRWIATRPECVRKLAAQFPPGSLIVEGERKLYLIGYTEDNELIVSAIDAGVDYAGAMEAKEYICADWLHRLEQVQ